MQAGTYRLSCRILSSTRHRLPGKGKGGRLGGGWWGRKAGLHRRLLGCHDQWFLTDVTTGGPRGHKLALEAAGLHVLQAGTAPHALHHAEKIAMPQSSLACFLSQ